MLRLPSFPVALLVFYAIGTNLSASEPIDFDTEVMPVLTRHGCNAGSCHGSAAGRGGFKLSLLGSNAAADHDAIARQLEGRRINTVAPERSLLLLKPSEQLGHEGGLVLEEHSKGFHRLHQWIREGAQRSGDRQLDRLVISPAEITLDQPETSVSVRVTATYTDGSSADVTDWTVFQASDTDAISISQVGCEVVVHRRGVHVMIARYLDRVMPVRLTVPIGTKPTASESLTQFNEVDRFINEQMRALRLPVSPPADDGMFLRRVTLDLTGRLPTAETAKQFQRNQSPDKRQRLIDELLSSDSFADYWALKWANTLGIDSKQLQKEGANAYHEWLRQQLIDDTPWDVMATSMLTGSGDSYQDGSLNFLRSAGSPGELAERTSRSLMGVRLQCANCHDHPLDHWKQDDYHGLAAVFAKLRRERVISVSDRGEVTHPVTRQAAVPRIPGEHYLEDVTDGRMELADWLTGPDNPYFAKAIVNRIWQQLMGRGLVDPVDDLRATNPASHPKLIQWLADDFVRNGFSVRHTIQTICNSAAYARDSRTIAGNENDVQHYSHALTKPLEAEVIADAIADITGVPLQIGDDTLPRSVTLTDNRLAIPSLDILGRCDREESCTSAVSSASLARSLHLINGELINARVRAASGRLTKLLDDHSDNSKVLDLIFLETLSQPSVSEQEFWKAELKSLHGIDATQRRAFFEDLLWGILTSRSFMSNQ